MRAHPPILWSIAGHDTAGGAGLSADQRAADAVRSRIDWSYPT